MPTREDVDLARAAIERGFLTIKESVKCLEIQRNYEQNGKQLPLEHIFVEAQFLTPKQVTLIKEALAKQAALRKIGTYEILSKVGAGGMGTVYRARDTNADRIVALKVLSPSHASNKDYIQRFLREAHASGQLSHPNIVQGYDAGEANGQYYFAMEFIDGITVADMLKEGRAIPEQQALDIAIQIAKALQHAEENHIIHRDIKPDNIMITKDGVAKLADLGLARLTTAVDGGAEHRSFGTVYYASPEQCQGAEDIDSKTDMYSFGATLFHMLAGRVPFDADSPEGIMTKHLDEKPSYLKDINVQLSHGVSKIIRKLMAKQKRDRYAAAAEIVTDLTLVRMGRSPRLGEHSRYDESDYRYRSDTGSWRTKPADRRKRFLLAAILTGFGVLMLTIGYILFQFIRPPAPAPPANQSTAHTTPRGAARPFEQIYFEDEILARQGSMSRADLLQKLRLFAQKFPSTASAARANELAATVLKQLEDEIEPAYQECIAAARQLTAQHEYSEALAKLAAFAAEHKDTRFPAQADALGKELKTQAETEFKNIQAESAKRLADNDYAGALALYQPVTETLGFGLPDVAVRANADIQKIKAAQAAYEKQLAEAARRAAEEQRKREALRAEKLALRAAVIEARSLVVQSSRYADAAARLQAAAKLLVRDESKPALERAAADLGELQAAINGLPGSANALRGKPITVTRKDDTTPIAGTLFSIGSGKLSVQQPETGAIRSIAFSDLSLDSLRALLELSTRGNLSAPRLFALAALYAFAGRPDDAKTLLDTIPADSPDRKDADLRKADADFLAHDPPEPEEITAPQPTSRPAETTRPAATTQPAAGK